jgi:nucleotide-binding universal stress UspA family protein
MAEHRVIVPLDGSRLAEHSLVYLDALRRLGEIDVLLIGVVDAKEALNYPDPPAAIEKEATLLASYLREVAQVLERESGLHAEVKVPIGSPAERILTEAGEHAADLIVISTHGRSGLSRWRLGSVADKVIRGAGCNVFVVGPQASEEGAWLEGRLKSPFARLLVPLDGSELAESALSAVTEFSDRYSSSIHFVQVVQVPLMYEGVGGTTYTPDLLDGMIEASKKYLDETARKLDQPDAVTHILVGSAADKLRDYVERNDISLVIMTSRGRGGILRTALGSVTDRMLAGYAPVLVVEPEA